MEALYGLLKSMGMQVYESKAYICLLQNGVCTADQISKMGEIPLPRVYETLSSLHKRGMVKVLKSRPQKYHAVSGESLKALIEEKKEKMTREVEKSEELYSKILQIMPKKIPKMSEAEKQDFWIVAGRKNIIKSVIEQQKRANSEILIFGDDLSWLPEFHDILRKKRRDGVKIRILCNINNRTRRNVQKALSMGIELRELQLVGLMGNIIDGKFVMMGTKNPRPGVKDEQYYGIPGTDRLFAYEAINTENPTLLRAFTSYFDIAWTKGKTPKEIFGGK